MSAANLPVYRHHNACWVYANQTQFNATTKAMLTDHSHSQIEHVVLASSASAILLMLLKSRLSMTVIYLPFVRGAQDLIRMANFGELL